MGDEDLPKTAVDALAHLALASVPLIEIADHRNARRVWRPNRENDAIDAFVARELRAQAPIELLVRALDQKIIVERPQRRAKSVSVLVRFDAVGARDFETVGRAFRSPRNQGLEEIALAASEFGDRRPARVTARTLSASVTKARITHPWSVRWGPRTAKGSSCRAAAIASTSSCFACQFLSMSLPLSGAVPKRSVPDPLHVFTLTCNAVVV